MRGINYLAGLGTVLVFIGIFCFRTLFRKENIKGYAQSPKEVSRTNKIIIFISGIITVALGLLLILKSMKIV